MYMNTNELYIDKVVNLAYSNIDETKSDSFEADFNSGGKTLTSTFSYTTPAIGFRAGIYRGSISLSLTASYFQYSVSCKGYFSLGGTYRLISDFPNSLSNTSLTNIEVVSGSLGSNMAAASQTFSGTKDLRNYVRVA